MEADPVNNEPLLPSKSPSAFARKYGNHSDWKLRSGYTPTDSAFPNSRLVNSTGKSLSDDKQTERFQRERLNDFTTRELIDLDAISDRKLEEPNLQNAVVPLFAIDPTCEPDPDAPDNRSRYIWHASTWDDGTNGSYPPLFKDDQDGDNDAEEQRTPDDKYWTSRNSSVRRILRPIIVLASRLLESPSYTSFVSCCADGGYFTEVIKV